MNNNDVSNVIGDKNQISGISISDNLFRAKNVAHIRMDYSYLYDPNSSFNLRANFIEGAIDFKSGDTDGTKKV